MTLRVPALLLLWLPGLTAAGLSGAGCGDGTPAEALPGAALGAAPQCSGENDGVIAPGELDFTPGPVAPYAVLPEGGPPAAGAAVPGDAQARLWDFSDAAFDHVEQVPLLSPAGQWWAGRFPQATVALPFGAEDTGAGDAAADPSAIPSLLVLAASAREVTILGVASVVPEALLLIYDQPVALFRFPLQPGASWSAETRFAAGSRLGELALDGLEVVDRYTLTADGRGSLRLPGMSLDNVLRLDVQVERQFAALPPWQAGESYLLQECLGVVARRGEPGGAWWVIWYPM